jgi:thiamine-phosphate pyrophosphorylase
MAGSADGGRLLAKKKIGSMGILRQVDWTLYVVTDSCLVDRRSLTGVIEAAIRGGAGVIQYREKHADTRQMIISARALCQVCRRLGAVFLVNDRLDVALAVDADGVHVGQQDMPVALARTMLGPDKLLGVSVQDARALDEAESQGADYLSLSPVFATPTKPDHEEPLGLEAVRALAGRSRLPVVAIGGINSTNVAQVMRAGAQGICVISAVLGAPDPERAARELYELAKAVREEGGGVKCA